MDERMINTREELSIVLRKLAERVIIVPAKGKKLTRNSENTAGGTGSDTTLDHYYVELINDTLDAIRSGETAYIFNARQIADVKSFEPKAKFEFEDGAIAVSLAA